MSNIFHISEAASIAIHTMVCISGCGIRMQAYELSRITGFSKSHIAKVLGMLVKAGLLESVRGPLGGFQLARPASTITLLEVYEAIEGKLDADSCPQPCPLCESLGCLTGELGVRFIQDFKNYMSRRKLSDFQANNLMVKSF